MSNNLEFEVQNNSSLKIKCIASNIRKPLPVWTPASCVPGVGKEGDLILVEAIKDHGSIVTVENPHGRDERIYAGDRFIGVLASRHSGTSESGDVPEEGIPINYETRLHLLCIGGAIGINTGIPLTKSQEPFVLKTVGLLRKDDKILNLADICGPWDKILTPSAPLVVVCGTSAEVGKTTTAASLVRALKKEGIKVGATKFAGTGRLRDILSLKDAGADIAIDFPDVGLATTYTGSERFLKATRTLFNRINEKRPDIIVAEAGGDPIEANIPTFLKDELFMRNVKVFVIVAGDVMGMMGSIAYLRKYAPDIPMFLTDPKGRNPVTTRERVAYELPGIPIFNSLNASEVQNVAKQILTGK